MTVQSIQMPSGDKQQLLELFEPQGELMREVVLDLIPMIHDRIHIKGLNSDGAKIGTYTDAYMKTRTGTTKHRINAVNLKTKKGFSATASGAARPVYHRTSDTDVIISLTRQLENDYACLPGDVGWGVGFNNAHNFDKATWNNTRYGVAIYDLTDDELKRVVELTEKLITERSREIS